MYTVKFEQLRPQNLRSKQMWGFPTNRPMQCWFPRLL